MTIIDVLFATISLFGIVYLFFWGFRQYRIDRFRQNVFSVRDELFLYAAEGGISFEHPAYRTLRNMLNGYIRFSHRITASRFFVHAIAMEVRGLSTSEFSNTWKEVTKGLSEDERSRLDTFLEQASAQLFYYLFLSSISKKLLALLPVLAIGTHYLVTRRKVLASKPQSTEIVHDHAVGDDRIEHLRMTTYQYTGEHIPQVRGSIEHFNSDAISLGRQYAAA